MTISLGTVFWREDDSGGHFYVVITPPSYPEILVVNFTTQGRRKDQSCVVQPGEHANIVDESVISFDHAAVVLTSEVQTRVDDGTFSLKDTVTDELLLKVWEGAYKTNRMTIRCQELLSETVPN